MLFGQPVEPSDQEFSGRYTVNQGRRGGIFLLFDLLYADKVLINPVLLAVNEFQRPLERCACGNGDPHPFSQPDGNASA